jgi:hypothetical protein
VAGKNVIFGSKKPKSDRLLGQRTLSELEFADYTTAIQILRRHQGQSLSTVVSEWDAAAKALGGESIVAACEAQANANRKKNGFKPTLLSRVYDQFLEGLKRDGASVRYIEDCRSRMGQIKDTFRGYIHNVDMADLEAWLNTKKNQHQNSQELPNCGCDPLGFRKEQWLPSSGTPDRGRTFA